MDFHGLIEDRISSLPCDVFTNILSKFNLANVREMKVISKTFRRMISSEPFSVEYNYNYNCHRGKYDDDVWALSHRLISNESIGSILCIRHWDLKQVAIPLDPFFHDIVGKYDILRLLFVAGSYLLYSLLNDCGMVSLFVDNVFSSKLQRIPLPPHGLNFRVLRHVKIILYPHYYKIRYAQLMTGDIPSYYEYNSVNEDWEVTMNAIRAKNIEMLNTKHAKSFIVSYPDFLYKVSFDFQGLVYQKQDATQFVSRALDQVDLGSTSENGWKHIISCHYGRISEGWVCTMVRCPDPYAPPGKAFLFRVSDNRDKDEFVSQISCHLILAGFNIVDASCLHQRHNSLNIS